MWDNGEYEKMNTASDHRAPQMDDVARKRWPAYGLLIVGLTAILAGLTWQIVQTRATVAPRAGENALGLPHQLAGQPVSDLQTGTAALNIIRTMHGKDFALVGGAVAHYGVATVWVARARDAVEAKSMTAAMKDRIAAGRSPFAPTGARQVSGHTVYTLTGLGQAHFYWQAGDKVIWLAAAPAVAEDALQELVRAIQ